MPEEPLIFRDRAEAGRQLAKVLPRFEPAETVVLALPRGGVPVAAEICESHRLPLDLILVRKIASPYQPELALGAIADGETPQIVINEEVARHHDLSRHQIEAMGRNLLPEIERRRKSYLAGRGPLPLEGKTVIVVDDGVATGATLRAALTALREANPARIVVALPVGPSDLGRQLGGLADAVYCLRDLRHFGAVGGAYRRFPQVEDATVRSTLARFAQSPAA